MTNTELDEARAEALAHFSQETGAPPISRITQRGRDPETARFTFELTDGRSIRIGTIKVLWSQTELAKVIAVSCGVVIARVKPSEWQNTLAVLLNDCVDVEETEGESFEDTVTEWVTGYIGAVSSLDVDQNTAAGQGSPFREDQALHVSAGQLAKYVRREFSEQVKLPELRTALGDLGFKRKTVMYTKGGKRSSASYYVLDDATALLPQAETEGVT